MKDKSINKKSEQELQEFLAFRKRASRVEGKRGKGTYKRHPKHRNAGGIP